MYVCGHVTRGRVEVLGRPTIETGASIGGKSSRARCAPIGRTFRWNSSCFLVGSFASRSPRSSFLEPKEKRGGFPPKIGCGLKYKTSGLFCFRKVLATFLPLRLNLEDVKRKRERTGVITEVIVKMQNEQQSSSDAGCMRFYSGHVSNTLEMASLRLWGGSATQRSHFPA